MTDLVSISATGLPGRFALAGVLSPADIHLARLLCRGCGESDERVELAAALTCRQVRLGSVQMDPTEIAAQITRQMLDPAVVASAGPEELAAIEVFGSLDWPDPTDWLARLEDSPAVAHRDSPVNRRGLRLDSGLVYLERYWQAEQQVALLTARLAADRPEISPATAQAALDTVAAALDGAGIVLDPAQAQAALRVCDRRLSVLAGGPGTGKTTAVCAVLAVLKAADPGLGPISLAAPSGKAAARLRDAVAEVGALLPPEVGPGPLEATTVHALLGSMGPGRGFRHDRNDPLPCSLVVIDETSMLSLPMTARLLEAVGPGTRVLLVGDPGQLVSVDAGSVLADVVASAPHLGPDMLPVTTLTRNHRSGGAIAELSEAVRRGLTDEVIRVLDAGDESVRFVAEDPAALSLADLPDVHAEITSLASRMTRLAGEQDDAGALELVDEHRLLCAHRQGPYGVSRWSEEMAAAERAGRASTDPGERARTRGEWSIGQPVIVNQNMRQLEVNNGDCGVVVAERPVPMVALPSPGGTSRRLPCSLVGSLRPLEALTVHKAQGSQFGRVTVVLPPPESPLLTRELLYTAITRARRRLVLVGTRESVVRAVSQTSRRQSGLTRRWRELGDLHQIPDTP
ncbi:exodeoxyribonuclease V subunit alpha [Acidipropionibacterium jensenii]|uniref:exodeoxyribonuclease V subunit alpha n=1 Tax=Acidipropionibacterium jensenii TaxID=1749 RepID=UPI0026492B25|nr:exodeoxyribonuclease V subunit alpha [Acidipropionibacterium jensenii]MDN6426917.1 exodeoxyribonuclease V subunit alpha [Acidipropionibacterium jensenii]MDN6479553.1 exodeoxyribonuclease V subunit alpha [Acidipropionibacterium jensenii]MDN6591145.1 exodeoxyribonuclease V subunit alpha [Acidipropionibacterium jensenii]MDN6760870.1 exodeoxyribonuclease V subunit alpha [Acidipropionibacterium jensenii]MDN6811927.1 exodeoxyribonuclease V subunit alpha [Acidipropionibacterium jensenii]